MYMCDLERLTIVPSADKQMNTGAIFECQLGVCKDSTTFWVGILTSGVFQLKLEKSEIPTSKYKWNAAL